MSDLRAILERGVSGVAPPSEGLERMLRRRDRRQRNRKVGAAVVGISVAAALVFVASRLDLSDSEIQKPTPTPSGATEEFPSDTTPTEGSAPLEGATVPLVRLDNGVFFVDLTTGDATRLPASIVAERQRGYQPGQYQASPDGSQVLWWAEAMDPPGTVQIFVANVDGSGAIQVTHDPDGALRAAWHPSGQQIVYVGRWRVGEGNMNEDVEIFILDLRTGATSSVIADRAGDLQEPHFAPDGRSILFTRDGADLWTVPVSGGESSLLREGRPYAEHSRDGSSIAFPRFVDIPLAGGHGGLSGQEIWVEGADGSDPRPVAWGGENPWGGETGRWSPDGTRLAYNFGPSYVTELATGATTMIATRSVYVYGWLDDETLIVGSWR